MSEPVALSSAARQIEHFVIANPGCTFPELMTVFGEWAEGEFEFALRGYPNIVLWTGMSERFIRAIEYATRIGLVHREPAPIVVYIVGGTMLRLPLAKSVRAYSTPHWLPTVFLAGQVTRERTISEERAARRDQWHELANPKTSDVSPGGLDLPTRGRNSKPLVPVDSEQVARCARWLETHATKSERRSTDSNSYTLKHLVERGCAEHGCEWDYTRGYVTNGAFIAAAIRAGFRVWYQRSSPNATFNMSILHP